MNATPPSTLLVTCALIAVQILFGVNYVISKTVVDAFPPLVWASIRIVIATGIMGTIAILSRRKHPTGGRNFFLPLIVFALFGTIINQSSFLVGLRYTSATNSAILNTMIPVFTLLIVTVRGQEPLTWRRGIGFVLAFAGVLAIRKVENFTLSDQTAFGDFLTVLNCLSYGIFLTYSKKFMEQNDRVWVTVWMFLYGSIGIGLVALPDWIHFSQPTLTPALLWAMAFSILGGTILTYFLNFWALAYARSSSVALFIYLQPIFAAFLAWAWHHEIPSLRTMISGLMIFAGMIFALETASKNSTKGTVPARS